MSYEWRGRIVKVPSWRMSGVHVIDKYDGGAVAATMRCKRRFQQFAVVSEKPQEGCCATCFPKESK